MCAGARPPKAAAACRRQRGLCVPVREERLSRDLFFSLGKQGRGCAWCRGKQGAHRSGHGARGGAPEMLLSPASPGALPASSVPAAGSAKHKPSEMLPASAAAPAPAARDSSAPRHASCSSHPSFPPPVPAAPLDFLLGICFGFWVSGTSPHPFLASRSPSSLLVLGPGQHQQCKGSQGQPAPGLCISLGL